MLLVTEYAHEPGGGELDRIETILEMMLTAMRNTDLAAAQAEQYKAQLGRIERQARMIARIAAVGKAREVLLPPGPKRFDQVPVEVLQDKIVPRGWYRNEATVQTDAIRYITVREDRALIIGKNTEDPYVFPETYGGDYQLLIFNGTLLSHGLTLSDAAARIPNISPVPFAKQLEADLNHKADKPVCHLTKFGRGYVFNLAPDIEIHDKRTSTDPLAEPEPEEPLPTEAAAPPAASPLPDPEKKAEESSGGVPTIEDLYNRLGVTYEGVTRYAVSEVVTLVSLRIGRLVERNVVERMLRTTSLTSIGLLPGRNIPRRLKDKPVPVVLTHYTRDVVDWVVKRFSE
jgi:hypothetical protein